MSQLDRGSFALETEGDWIHITPRGPQIVARDGRKFSMSNADAVVAKSTVPALVDWDHESELFTGSTRAAGWVEALAVRSSGVWGRVKWTAKGKADIADSAYRFLSPVLELNPETKEVLSIISIALTNRPALQMSQIGDTNAYRIACSQRVQQREALDNLPKGVRERLHRNGMSDDAIAATLAFQQTDAYRGPGKKKQPAPTEAETRAACLARGNMSAEAYDATRKFIDEQRARLRGE
jgi:phage I-like protein